MDLGAYAQIDNLSEILNEQGIYVPRLRGLRLMSNEKPVSQEDIEESIRSQWLYICKHIIEQNRLDCWCSWKEDTRNDILIRGEADEYGYREVVGVHWDKVHGKKRKRIKFEMKKAKRAILEQYNTFNKYVGQNILYVHARIGGLNWNAFDGDKVVAAHPDFLCKVDDYFDCTYCDIYFRLHKTYELIDDEEVEE